MATRHNTTDHDKRTDRFAEHVANGARPFEAGQMLGLTKGQAARVWANIKKQLGAQAR